ncbi:MAG: F0F1 ATP synthase subunit delta [Patescibacteria group bacterium]
MAMDKAYAAALWKIVEGGATPKSAVKTLREALAARGRTGLLPRISKAFARLASRAEVKSAVVLKIAREKDEKTSLKEARTLLANESIRPSEVKTSIDENLIGGWRLEGRELLHDVSYKKQLLDIYENVSGR